MLGVGIVGSGAGELIAEGALAIEMGATAEDLKLVIHPHPTLSETLMESAEVFFGQSTHVLQAERRSRSSVAAGRRPCQVRLGVARRALLTRLVSAMKRCLSRRRCRVARWRRRRRLRAAPLSPEVREAHRRGARRRPAPSTPALFDAVCTRRASVIAQAAAPPRRRRGPRRRRAGPAVRRPRRRARRGTPSR